MELRLERRRNAYVGRDFSYRGTAPMGMKLIKLTNGKAAIIPASDVAHSREPVEANVQTKQTRNKFTPAAVVMHLPPQSSETAHHHSIFTSLSQKVSARCDFF
jgi:hypothetical protein